MDGMGAAHFIFIPSVLMVGVVIGWVLGSRAARDAYAAELKRREERQQRNVRPKLKLGPTTAGHPYFGVPNTNPIDRLIGL